jgi:transcriptional regulator with GAF, ATPase, and Fis domain
VPDHVGSDYCPVVDPAFHSSTHSSTHSSSHSSSGRSEDGEICHGGEFKLPTDGIDLDIFEKSMLVQALERTRFNQTKAARLLHVTRHTLRYRLEKFGLLVGTA